MYPIIPTNIQHSFCSAKWKWVTMHFGMKSNHSCYHPAPHHWIPADIVDNPSGIHNTKFKQEQRTKMLSGVRPPECHYCWQVEDLDPTAVSDRKNFNRMFNDSIPGVIETNNVSDVAPSYLEVSFNHSCNLACSYCSPGQSSRWHTEVSKFGPYPVDDKTSRVLHEIVPEETNPYIKAFWKWLPDIYSGLQYIRITGGEPLMSNSADQLLDFIEQHNNQSLTVAYNTNLCTPTRRIEKLIKQIKVINTKCKKFIVYTSCDTHGAQAEYIRHGFEWDTWCKHVEMMLAEKVDVSVMVTFGLLSVFNFSKFVDQILTWRKAGHNIVFDCSALIEPAHFDLRILDDRYLPYWDSLSQYIDKHKSLLTEQEQRTVTNLFLKWDARSQLNNREYLLSQFKIFTAEHDKRREVNLLSSFPEIRPLFNE